MHNNEFERQVQQKTEGLKITPSEGMWDAIEGQLPPEKKRRRPLLWLLLGLLLAGGGAAWWLVGNNKPATTNNQPLATTQPVAGDKQTAMDDSSHRSVLAKQFQPESIAANTATKNLPQQTAPPTSVNSPKLDSNQGVVDRLNQRRLAGKANMRITQQQANVAVEPEVGESRQAFLSNKKTAGQIKTTLKVADIATETPIDTAVETADLTKLPMPLVATLTVSTDPIKQLELAERPLIEQVGLQITAPNVVEKRKWVFGLTAGIGLSRREDKLFSTADENRLSAIIGTGTIPGTYYDSFTNRTINSFKPGLSFHIGFYANRQIGNRWYLQTGLVYNYQSNRQPAGKEYSALATITQFVNNVYVSLGNKAYTNQIQLIQIPIELQYKLGKSKWNLQAGIEGGYILRSNLLVYNANAFVPVYLKGNNLYNRVQLLAHIGTGFSPRKGSSMVVGARMQYGLTSLVKIRLGAQRMIAAQVFFQMPFKKK